MASYQVGSEVVGIYHCVRWGEDHGGWEVNQVGVPSPDE